MKENINELILDKIENSDYEKAMKDFLKELLLLELSNSSGKDHSQLYDSKLKSFSKKYVSREDSEDVDGIA